MIIPVFLLLFHAIVKAAENLTNALRTAYTKESKCWKLSESGKWKKHEEQ